MVRKFIVALLMLFFLCGRADARQSVFPSELEHAAPEVAGLLEDNAEGAFGFAQGVSTLVNEAISRLRDYLLEDVRNLSALLIGVILLGMVEGVAGDGVSSRQTTLVGALYISAVSAGDIETMIGLGRETVGQLSTLSKVLIPSLAAATAAGGGIVSASVRQVATVFFADIMLTVMDRLLLPMLYLYIAAAVAVSVLEYDALESVASLLKKGIGWILAAMLGMFTTYLSISGAIAGAVDEQTVRVAKTAVSAAVPVVGGILAEAAESVLAGAGVLRGMIGVFGALAVLSLCLLPFLRLGCQYLVYQLAVFVANASGPKKTAKLLSKLGDAFALVLAMTGSSALILIISLVSTLTVVMR